jgi:hypothetical protein
VTIRVATMRRAISAALALAAMASPAVSAEAVTVQSLISDGYTAGAAWMSPIGPAIFLQKADSLYLCFVTETSDNPVITTNYCKSVH